MASKAAPGKDQTETILAENLIWKENVPYLYESLINYKLSESATSVQWLPRGFPSQNSLDHIVVGSCYDEEKEKTGSKLEVFSVEIKEHAVTTKTAERPESTNSHLDKKRRVIASKHLHLELRLSVKFPVSRVRSSPLLGAKTNGSLVAVKSASNAEVLIYLLKKAENTTASQFSLTAYDVTSLKGHEEGGRALAWNHLSAGSLVSGSMDCNLCNWDTLAQRQPKSTPKSIYKGHQAEVLDAAWQTNKANVFASCSRDKTVRVWDSRQKKESHKIEKAHDAAVNSISWNPLGEYLLASGSDDKTVALWDMRNLDGKLFSLDHLKPVTCVAFSPTNETILASASEDRRVVLWDITKVAANSHLSSGGNKGSQSITRDSDGPEELSFVHGGHTDSICDISWHREDIGLMATLAKNCHLHIWKPALKHQGTLYNQNRLKKESKR